jgi:hypothetical protein
VPKPKSMRGDQWQVEGACQNLSRCGVTSGKNSPRVTSGKNSPGVTSGTVLWRARLAKSVTRA